ncbi:hypothetical protein ONS96_014938 [Cadophora gregata f. sp. sojae]|nr:hypothetical protein ONS96_014938 [Cadophora gregata f. sp. sojae]
MSRSEGTMSTNEYEGEDTLSCEKERHASNASANADKQEQSSTVQQTSPKLSAKDQSHLSVSSRDSIFYHVMVSLRLKPHFPFPLTLASGNKPAVFLT